MNILSEINSHILKKEQGENITSIFLKDSKIERLPTEIKDLHLIKHLFLEDMSLVSLGDGIKFLKGLQAITLSNLPNIEQFFSEVCDLKSLKYLMIKNCPIQTLTKNIKNLNLLEELIIINTSLTELPSECFSLPNLKKLFLNTVLLDSISGELERLQKLESLTLNYVKHLPKEIESLKLLEHVRLCKIPKGISYIKSMKKLELIGVNECIDEFYELKYLEELIIKDGSINFANLPNRLYRLKHVTIDSETLSVFPEFLLEVSSLEVIQICEPTGITEFPLSIMSCPDLQFDFEYEILEPIEQQSKELFDFICMRLVD